MVELNGLFRFIGGVWDNKKPRYHFYDLSKDKIVEVSRTKEMRKFVDENYLYKNNYYCMDYVIYPNTSKLSPTKIKRVPKSELKEVK